MLLPFQGVHQGKALKLFHYWGCMAERRGATPHIATLKNNIWTETESLGPAFSLMPLVLTKVEERHIFPLLLPFPGNLPNLCQPAGNKVEGKTKTSISKPTDRQ